MILRIRNRLTHGDKIKKKSNANHIIDKCYRANGAPKRHPQCLRQDSPREAARCARAAACAFNGFIETSARAVRHPRTLKPLVVPFPLWVNTFSTFL